MCKCTYFTHSHIKVHWLRVSHPHLSLPYSYVFDIILRYCTLLCIYNIPRTFSLHVLLFFPSVSLPPFHCLLSSFKRPPQHFPHLIMTPCVRRKAKKEGIQFRYSAVVFGEANWGGITTPDAIPFLVLSVFVGYPSRRVSNPGSTSLRYSPVLAGGQSCSDWNGKDEILGIEEVNERFQFFVLLSWLCMTWIRACFRLLIS